MEASPTPTGARAITKRLLALTWSDGAVLHYPADDLRARCPCAECTHGVADTPPLARGAFAGVELKSLDQVGHYAFRIAFSDGHSVGLYPFVRLRSMGYAPGTEPPPVQLATDPFDV